MIEIANSWTSNDSYSLQGKVASFLSSCLAFICIDDSFGRIWRRRLASPCQPRQGRSFFLTRYHSGSPVSGFSADQDRVEVQLDSGASVPADLFVAADGPRSVVRHQLLPHVERRYAGYVAWRGVSARTAPEAGRLREEV